MFDNPWVIIGLCVVLFGGMMAMQFFRRKKQGQIQEEVRQTLVPGATVITIGGIVCKLVEVNDKDDTLLLEMIPSGVQFTIIKNALYNVKKSPAQENAEGKEPEIVNYDDGNETETDESQVFNK